MAEVSGAERRTVAIAALGQLVASGVLPEEALEHVTAALARGDEALANLPAQAPGQKPSTTPTVPVPPRSGGN